MWSKDCFHGRHTVKYSSPTKEVVLDGCNILEVLTRFFRRAVGARKAGPAVAAPAARATATATVGTLPTHRIFGKGIGLEFS